MSGAEERDTLGELVAEVRHDERLRALAEYAELRRRWLAGEAQPDDRLRRRAAKAVLDRTGGVPSELSWPKRREG